MARTLLEIGRAACIRAGLAPPTQIVGSNHTTARRIAVAAEDTISHMARRAGHGGWSDLRSEWVFMLRPGKYAYALPADFLRPATGTFRRDGSPFSMLAPASPRQWAAYRSGPTEPVAPYAWRIANGALVIEPPAQAEEIMRFEYQSRYPVVRSAAITDYQIMGPSADGSSTFYLPRVGLVPLEGAIDVNPGDVATEAGSSWDVAPPGWDEAKWGGPLEGYYALFRREVPLAAAKVRVPTFESDDDEPAFRFEHPVSLGITWRMLRQLRQPYAEERAEYEAAVSAALGWDNGGAHDILVGAEAEWPDAYPTADSTRWMVS